MSEHYKKRVKTKRRLKEWESNPFLFSYWRRLFHFERIEFILSAIAPTIRLLGLYRKGLRNSINFRHRTIVFRLPRLPRQFDSFRVLYMSDFHCEKNAAVMRAAARYLRNLYFDLAILGGDYRFKIKGSHHWAVNGMKDLVGAIRSAGGIYGVLGNHDSWEMIEALEKTGIKMLVNEFTAIKKNGASIYLTGVDDAHYFESDDYKTAVSGIESDAFQILISHSNDILTQPLPRPADLILCAHTHGGQIRLPLIGAPMLHSRMPRRFCSDTWDFKGMPGFTTNGLGTSGVPVRFNCPAEVVTIVLKAQ